MEKNETEETLIQNARRGDQSAFKKLYDEHAGAVFQTAYRLTGSRTSAEDITQEVFIAVYNHLDDFNFNSAFSTWCYRITVNQCLDLIRKQKRRGKYKKGTINPEKFDQHLGSEKDNFPDKKLNRKQLLEIIHQQLQKLNKDLKVTFVLREFEQLPYKKIAEILDCSQGTVASRLARARSAIANNLQKMGIDRTYLN